MSRQSQTPRLTILTVWDDPLCFLGYWYLGQLLKGCEERNPIGQRESCCYHRINLVQRIGKFLQILYNIGNFIALLFNHTRVVFSYSYTELLCVHIHFKPQNLKCHYYGMIQNLFIPEMPQQRHSDIFNYDLGILTNATFLTKWGTIIYSNKYMSIKIKCQWKLSSMLVIILCKNMVIYVDYSMSGHCCQYNAGFKGLNPRQGFLTFPRNKNSMLEQKNDTGLFPVLALEPPYGYQTWFRTFCFIL